MTTLNTRQSFSRRAGLAGLGAGALGLAMAARRSAASAQDATPYPMTDHPIIGVWQMDNETRQPDTDVSFTIFADDGKYVAGQRDYGGIEVGMWRATGERTAELVDVYQVLGPQDMFAPDYAPEGNLFEPGGLIVHRGVLEVDATGNTVILRGAVEFRAPDGTVEGSGNYAGLGTRMAIVATVAAATSTP